MHPGRVYAALKSSVSGWSLQATLERKGYFNPFVATGKLGHERETCTGSNRKVEGEPRFESYLRNHSHRNIRLSYWISFNLNAIIFTFFFSMLVDNSCNYFIVLNTLRKKLNNKLLIYCLHPPLQCTRIPSFTVITKVLHLVSQTIPSIVGKHFRSKMWLHKIFILLIQKRFSFKKKKRLTQSPSAHAPVEWKVFCIALECQEFF